MRTQRMNVKEDAIVVLKTVVLLEQSYGMNYLIRVLQGAREYGFKEDHHETLETFGIFQELYVDRVRDLVMFLIKENYLEVLDKRFGNLGITEKGKNYVDSPTDLWVPARALRASRLDKKMLRALKKARKAMAEQASKPPFHIFTDYTLYCLVDEKPKDQVELIQIPGIGEYKAEEYGNTILDAINEVLSKKAEEDHARMLKKADSPSHQEIKRLFETGMSIEDIAAQRQIKPNTVRNSLYCLYKAQQIDLIPWIESTIDDQTLRKGTAYFQETGNPRLTQAQHDLGFDFDTLRLCRLYARKAIAHEESYTYA